ncbi:MAG: hypothetical protein R6W82_08375, partial [bacterium]
MSDRLRSIPLIEDHDPDAAQASPDDLWGRPVPRLNEETWRRVLQVCAGALVVWVADLLFPSPGWVRWWALALAAGWTWWTAVRMLLLDTKSPRFWAWWLGLSAAALLPSAQGPAGFIIAVVGSSLFLVFRTYQPYGHLAGSRRAGMAFLFLVALFLIPWGPGGEVTDAPLAGLGHHAALYGLVSL